MRGGVDASPVQKIGLAGHVFSGAVVHNQGGRAWISNCKDGWLRLQAAPPALAGAARCVTWKKAAGWRCAAGTGPNWRFRRQCREAGHEVLCVEADVADMEALERFADTAVSHFGRLDVWYNNAGMGIYKPLMDVSLEEWDGLMGINLRGVFAGSRLAAERMQQGGVIVNASSFAARMPVAGNGAYAVSKWGVEALTRVLAAELVARGIRVFAYMPGMIETELTRGRIEGHRETMTSSIPLNRLGTPEDLAPVLVMLTSDLAGYVTGCTVEISGGKFCVQNPHFAWAAEN